MNIYSKIMTRNISTRRKLYNLYCIDRGDRTKIQYLRFNINMNKGYTYSQLVDFEKGDTKRFVPQGILGLRKQQYWKDYLEEN